MFNAHVLDDRQRTEDILTETTTDFEALLLSENVIEGLHSAGFTQPSPIQLKAIPYAKIGLDLICQAKSGTGKTCVFAVSALEAVKVKHLAIQVLVLAPTREIAHQILGVITTIGGGTKGLKCSLFIGGINVENDIENLKSCHIAIGTPGRVKYLIEHGYLPIESIRLFVLDEADKLLEEGSFQEQINWIYSTLPKDKQVIALSATYPESLAKHLDSYMQDPIHVRISIKDLTLKGVKQYVTKTMFHPLPGKAFEEKCERLIEIIRKVPFQQCMVFSNFQKGAENLSKSLCKKGWPCTFIAGSQVQTARLRAMSQLKNYNCRIFITTDLTSRGIDCDKVDLVINLDLPWATDTYLHRVGRAGRFGSIGIAISIVSDGEEFKKIESISAEIGKKVHLLGDSFTIDNILDTETIEIAESQTEMDETTNGSTSNSSGKQCLMGTTSDTNKDKKSSIKQNGHHEGEKLNKMEQNLASENVNGHTADENKEIKPPYLNVNGHYPGDEKSSKKNEMTDLVTKMNDHGYYFDKIEVDQININGHGHTVDTIHTDNGEVDQLLVNMNSSHAHDKIHDNNPEFEQPLVNMNGRGRTVDKILNGEDRISLVNVNCHNHAFHKIHENDSEADASLTNINGNKHFFQKSYDANIEVESSANLGNINEYVNGLSLNDTSIRLCEDAEETEEKDNSSRQTLPGKGRELPKYLALSKKLKSKGLKDKKSALSSLAKEGATQGINEGKDLPNSHVVGTSDLGTTECISMIKDIDILLTKDKVQQEYNNHDINSNIMKTAEFTHRGSKNQVSDSNGDCADKTIFCDAINETLYSPPSSDHLSQITRCDSSRKSTSFIPTVVTKKTGVLEKRHPKPRFNAMSVNLNLLNLETTCNIEHDVKPSSQCGTTKDEKTINKGTGEEQREVIFSRRDNGGQYDDDYVDSLNNSTHEFDECSSLHESTEYEFPSQSINKLASSYENTIHNEHFKIPSDYTAENHNVDYIANTNNIETYREHHDYDSDSGSESEYSIALTYSVGSTESVNSTESSSSLESTSSADSDSSAEFDYWDHTTITGGAPDRVKNKKIHQPCCSCSCGHGGGRRWNQELFNAYFYKAYRNHLAAFRSLTH